MKVVIDEKERDVLIVRKRTNKNTYLRVKEDFIYVTTNPFTKEQEILKLIEENKTSISKMFKRLEKKKENEEFFSFLGKKYDIVFLNTNKVSLGEDKIFIPNKNILDKWLRNQASVIFKKELDKIYQVFPLRIPYPTLTIRSMTTRWGVCNVKTKRVTLNLELIKKDIKYLDYVIAHELSHLIHPNHSKEFWNLVGMVISDYKKLRKELNHYG